MSNNLEDTMNELKQEVCKVIKILENMKLTAYPDSKNIWTIGIGTTKYSNGTAVKKGDTCSPEQAIDWLNCYLELHVYPAVSNLQKTYLFNNRIYVSLCSFAYNLGVDDLQGKSIISALSKADIPGLAKAFKKYVLCNGKVDTGLQNRRNIEILYFTTNKDIETIHKQYYSNLQKIA